MQNTSEAARWHIYRAKSMKELHSQTIRALEQKGNHRSFAWIIILIVTQIFLAVYAGSLSWILIWPLSATIGAYIAWGLHCALHEISHGTEYISGVPWKRAILLKLSAITYPDVSLYAYYRWQHMAHHGQLAGNSVDEAKLAERIDADVLAIRNFYAVKMTKEGTSTAWSKGVFQKKLYKYLLGFIPMGEFFLNTLVFVQHALTWRNPAIWPEKYADRNISRLLRARKSIVQQIFGVCLVQGIVICLGGFGAFLYLWLSFLFIKGLMFHPYILFWLTEHKTTQHETYCQPTTSIYHWSTSWLFWNMNHHVEHHDFPRIAGRNLNVLSQACPHQYTSLFRFTSLGDAYRSLFRSEEVWVYGCQK